MTVMSLLVEFKYTKQTADRRSSGEHIDEDLHQGTPKMKPEWLELVC